MNMRRVSVWSSALIIGAAMFALVFAGLGAKPVGALPDPTPEPTITYISTWGSGTISQTPPLTYTGADILMYGGGDPRTGSGWTKYFDAAEAGLNPTGQWKHNLNAIWISDTAYSRNGSNGEFYGAFTQNQQKGIPGITGWVDGYDIVYFNGYSFTIWFDGEDVGLNVKTQEKIDSLEIMATAPVSSTFAGEDCEAYIALSTQGPGYVPAPDLSGRRKPVVKFRGEDVLGFCATNLGTNTTGFWELLIDGSTYEWPEILPGRRIPMRFTDSISMVPESMPYDGFYVMANRALPYHSLGFGFDPDSGAIQGPLEDFEEWGIDSPVDALHVTSIIR